MKINNIFDFLKAMTKDKVPVTQIASDDWDKFNSYMVHRFISMRPEFIDLVNEVQELGPDDKEKIYKIYSQFIPQGNYYFKYIKSPKDSVDKNAITAISLYYRVSRREARDYIQILDKSTIEAIKEKLNLDD